MLLYPLHWQLVSGHWWRSQLIPDLSRTWHMLSFPRAYRTVDFLYCVSILQVHLCGGVQIPVCVHVCGGWSRRQESSSSACHLLHIELPVPAGRAAGKPAKSSGVRHSRWDSDHTALPSFIFFFTPLSGCW